MVFMGRREVTVEVCDVTDEQLCSVLMACSPVEVETRRSGTPVADMTVNELFAVLGRAFAEYVNSGRSVAMNAFIISGSGELTDMNGRDALSGVLKDLSALGCRITVTDVFVFGVTDFSVSGEGVLFIDGQRFALEHSEEDVLELVESVTMQLQRKVAPATSPTASVVRLRELMRHDDPTVRTAVAGNAVTPEDVLTVLVHDTSYVVREAVAGNVTCSAELLLHLATDAEERVRAAVVANSACPPSVAAVAALQR